MHDRKNKQKQRLVEQIKNQFERIKYTGKDIVIVIGDNKADLTEKKVTQEDIDNLKKKKRILTSSFLFHLQFSLFCK